VHKSKGLDQFYLSQDEINKYENFLRKVAKIVPQYKKLYDGYICVPPFLLLHICFTDKNIIPNYYYPISETIMKKYEEIMSNISKLM
jgi:hypothetical protein